ncbi:hypothetical protein [Marinobacterium rhizophilum]|uniref:Uncharacterized protein n=1 Tax=Marinobacterium rhizophilum TaxID=420402 RepID=A0ABY5HLA7_9GAMM|nr:hypothetical protein [Marinobacterium rhizophilum]UTW12671.1 hypothetical protein KDW95_03030 [Marinobacterium rhizophilum]
MTSEIDDVQGYLTRASCILGANRFVLSYCENSSSHDPLRMGADAEYTHTAVAVFHDLNENLKRVAALNRTEVAVGGSDFEDTDTIAVGVVLTWSSRSR